VVDRMNDEERLGQQEPAEQNQQRRPLPAAAKRNRKRLELLWDASRHLLQD